MDDLDDLDNALFGKSFKVNESKTSIGSETKKKVMFKDFDESDPLGDLNLSDDDDFQESLKENPTPIIKDSKIANLFGIKSEDSQEVNDFTSAKSTENLQIEKEVPKTSIPIKNTLEEQKPKETVVKESDIFESANNLVPLNNIQINTPKMKSIFDDDNDIISNLSDKTKVPSKSQAKKSSLMEDLFGSRPKSSPSNDTSRRKDTFNFEAPPTRSNTGESLTGMLNESSSKTSNASGFSLSVSKEPRRGRRASTMQSDPLGLFSSSSLQIDETSKVEEKQIQPTVTEVAPKSVVIEDLPEWLGGPKVSKDQKPETEKTVRSEGLSHTKSTETLDKTSSSTNPIVTTQGIENSGQSSLAAKLLGMEFDQQAAIINMQQQEHELRTAAAVTQQSEKLNYLLETQKIKLTEQEKQFNMLIARQLERQALLEAQMKSQQDRIDSYIQTLTAQPSTVPSIHLTMRKNNIIDSKESMDEKETSKSLLQKLQLEKLYLENTLDSLREKHEKEITILEDSYKKQITFLEEAMVQMEKRMQDDVECIEADYKLKIQKLKEEIFEIEKVNRTEKEVLKEEHSKLLQEIRERHFKSLEILQKEHIETIERITKTKESERQAMEIMRIDGTNVENVLMKSNVIIEGLEDLQKKISKRDNNFIESQGSHLLIQEKNIEYLKKLLENEKEAFSEEKQKLMVTIQKLESYTSELTKEFTKQSASFNETENIFKAKEKALLRDRELFAEQSNWERERLQAMRDSWIKEQDMQLEWLAQERQALAIEKGKLQIFNRLKIGVDDSSKIELEATIKAAQDATASANQERLKWQEKMNDLEIQQRTLREKEHHLIQKAKELHEFTQSALAKREEGLQALKEAHFIEERYKEKYSQLQKQQEIIIQRESKLAAERLDLAKQRLSLHVSETDQPEKDTVRSQVIDHKINYEDLSNISEMPTSTQYTSYFKDIVDPHLVLLKWDLDNKLQVH